MVSEECFVYPQINATPQCGHAKDAGVILHKNTFFIYKRRIIAIIMLQKGIFLLLLEKLNETMLWLNKVGLSTFGVVFLKHDS